MALRSRRTLDSMRPDRRKKLIMFIINKNMANRLYFTKMVKLGIIYLKIYF